METVYRATNIIEAHIVSGLLQDAGINTFVAGHYLQGGVGEMAPMNFANVQVAAEDMARARRLIEQYESEDGIQ